MASKGRNRAHAACADGGVTDAPSGEVSFHLSWHVRSFGLHKHVEVSAVQSSRDFSALTDDERRAGANSAAFDLVVPADVARSMRRWRLSNVTQKVLRCGSPDEAYPADARLKGKRLGYEDLREPLPP